MGIKSKIRKKLYCYSKRKACEKQLKTITDFEDSRNEIIKELKYFPEEIFDLILIAKPERISGVFNLINSHLHLESIIREDERKVYSIGRAKQIFGYGNKINRNL